MSKITYIDEIEIKNKTVLLRVDFNVSLNTDYTISNDARIRQSLPTINYLLKNNNRLVIISHLGRPKGIDKKFSLKVVADKLKEYLPNFEISLAKDVEEVKQKKEKIVFLENIRFFPKEKDFSTIFAKQLSSLGDVYVNDAFGVCHRSDTSVIGPPIFLPAYGGLLLKKELEMISRITHSPKKPIAAIIGGAKVSTKVGLINKLIKIVDYLIIGGGLANTFVNAQGHEIGTSFCEYEAVQQARKLLALVKKGRALIVLPVDAVVAKTKNDKEHEVKKIDNISPEESIFDIGPETKAQIGGILAKAKTIIWNGPVGYFENPAFKEGTDFIYYSIAQNTDAVSIVGGGDTLAAISKKEYLDNFEKLPKTKRLIKGLNLEGSALELSYLHKMLGEKPSEKWKSAKECKNVLCALTKIYDSEETAARVLNIAKRDGYIVSASKDFTDENDKAIGQTFSPAEIRDIDLAYKMLPASFKKLGSLDKLKRLPNGYSSARAPMAAAYASPSLHLPIINYHRQGEITFLEGGFNSDKSWGPLVAVHELSHHVDYSSNKDHDLGISEGAAYRKLSGWKKKNTYKIDKTTGKKVLVSEWQSTKDKKFVTDYASTEPAEDFAESSAFYIYRPQELKSIDPEKYDFLKKNIFRGKEYLSSVEIPLPLSGLLKTCLDSKKSYTTYKERKYGRTSLSPNCLNNYFKEFLITDPNLCSYNTDQLKVTAADKIASQLNYLNNILNNAYDELPALTKECEDQNNYKEDCPGMKYFEKNNISAEKMNLSESETKNVQDSIGQKLHLEDFKRKNQKVIEALIAKRGKGSLLSEMLVGGLADKNKISNAFLYSRIIKFLTLAAFI